MSLHLVTETPNELVGKVEDKNGCAFDGFFKGWSSDKVRWKGNVWEVFDIFVLEQSVLSR